jgi:23S rRNA (cytosine1962-C5)-methyltransferase
LSKSATPSSNRHHGAMTTTDEHELIDVGDGRRLDRFGSVLLDRPCPPAEWWPQRDPGAWPSASARFERAVEGSVDHAGWTTRTGKPIESWIVREEAFHAELRLAASGQVGWFPEQAANRGWIGDRIAALTKPGRRGKGPDVEPPAVLNLFGYTGGSTLAAVAAGGKATHVDGARTAVAWARRNAELNGFAERPVRWIADDAVLFARRERKRGRRYAGIVLDPPSYGHGPGGHDWRLDRDLPGLLADIAALLEPWRGSFVLLSAHSGDVESGRIASWLERALGPGDLTTEPLALDARSGVQLHLGASARWVRRAMSA